MKLMPFALVAALLAAALPAHAAVINVGLGAKEHAAAEAAAAKAEKSSKKAHHKAKKAHKAAKKAEVKAEAKKAK